MCKWLQLLVALPKLCANCSQPQHKTETQNGKILKPNLDASSSFKHHWKGKHKKRKCHCLVQSCVNVNLAESFVNRFCKRVIKAKTSIAQMFTKLFVTFLNAIQNFLLLAIPMTKLWKVCFVIYDNEAFLFNKNVHLNFLHAIELPFHWQFACFHCVTKKSKKEWTMPISHSKIDMNFKPKMMQV